MDFLQDVCHSVTHIDLSLIYSKKVVRFLVLNGDPDVIRNRDFADCYVTLVRGRGTGLKQRWHKQCCVSKTKLPSWENPNHRKKHRDLEKVTWMRPALSVIWPQVAMVTLPSTVYLKRSVTSDRSPEAGKHRERERPRGWETSLEAVTFCAKY